MPLAGRRLALANCKTKDHVKNIQLCRYAALAPLLLLLNACSTTSAVQVVDAQYQTTVASQCEVTFFKKTTPEVKFHVLAKIETHVQRNFFFGGDAKLESEAYAELKTKACAMGGNAVIINDYVESRASEFSHVHVWATAIKLY